MRNLIEEKDNWDNKDKSNWCKEHTDMVIIISAFLAAVLWITSEIDDVKRDMTVIKTMLIMKNIMPFDIAKCEKEKS